MVDITSDANGCFSISDEKTSNIVRFVSYDSRGMNSSKQSYLRGVLADCDILFLQEHWLSEDQLCSLNMLSADHVSVGVSGFGNECVLSGRPFGGCAIFWRKTLSLAATPVVTNSRRICALHLSGNGSSLLCVCVYMPYESDSTSTDEFQFQLSIVDTVISQFPNSHIILGGDFNVDLSRNWTNTTVLNDYCRQACLFPVIHHERSIVDYTHHFNMKHFGSIDHFIVSEQLYQVSVCKQLVLHDVDNTSDHDPLCLHLALDVAQMDFCQRISHPKPSWDKAKDTHIAAYKELLSAKLRDIELPYLALVCKDVCCTNIDHVCSLNKYCNEIADACISSAEATIPVSRCRSTRGCIPGWSEYVAP